MSSNLNYTKTGDYFLPNLTLNQPRKQLNRYGRMRRNYLMEQRPVVYSTMLLNGTLYPHLWEVEQTAENRMQQLMKELLERNPAPDKEKNQMAWVQHMNSLKAQAEEMILTELYRHIGPDTDVPAGDIGVGGREIGFLFGQYKRIRDEYTGVLTGKGIPFGGSLARTEATGYGLCYFAKEMLADAGKSFEGQRVVISGSGNVAIYANQKATQLGGKVIAMSDSNGYIVDENGIDYKVMKEIKEVKRARIKTYLDYVPTAKYVEGSQGIWTVPCDIALPCATQNELPLAGAEALVANGCYAVAEGANMPSTPEAIAYLQAHGILFAPAKASNAGGVATSGLEMSQNSLRLSWTFEEVDERLHNIMVNIYKTAADAAERYGMKGNLVAGANIAGFEKIASAMMSQGIV